MAHNRNFTGRIINATSDEYFLYIPEIDLLTSISHQVMHKYCVFPTEMLDENGNLKKDMCISLYQSDYHLFYPQHAVYKCTNTPSALIRKRNRQSVISKEDIMELPPFSCYSDKVVDSLFRAIITEDDFQMYVKMLINDKQKAAEKLALRGINPLPEPSNDVRYIATAQSTEIIASALVELCQNGGGVLILGAESDQEIYGLEYIHSMIDTEIELSQAFLKNQDLREYLPDIKINWYRYGDKPHLLLVFNALNVNC